MVLVKYRKSQRSLEAGDGLVDFLIFNQHVSLSLTLTSVLVLA